MESGGRDKTMEQNKRAKSRKVGEGAIQGRQNKVARQIGTDERDKKKEDSLSKTIISLFLLKSLQYVFITRWSN